MYLFFDLVATDYNFILSTSGSALTPGGELQLQGIHTYMYTSQVCGSVPLYAVVQTAVGDHWYTMDMNKVNEPLSGG